MYEARVQSLVGELRSCMLHGMAEKQKISCVTCSNTNYFYHVKYYIPGGGGLVSLSHVRFLRSHGLGTYQAPPSMGFSRQEYWTALPFPSPGDLPNLGIKPRPSALQADYIPGAYLSYNWKFLLFPYLQLILLSPTITSGSHKSDLFCYEFVRLCLKYNWPTTLC